MKTFDVYTGMRTQHLSIPEKNFYYYAQHDPSNDTRPVREIIEDAIAHPIGDASLEKIPENAGCAVIIDDCTRPTPTLEILRVLIPEVEKRTSNITFITAPGTHRPLTEEELMKKLGSEYRFKYPVVNVDARIEEDYEYVGETKNTKVPIDIHKAVLAAEYRITVGMVSPHNMAGWGGGAKMIMPGVSGRRTVEGTHYRGSYSKMVDVIGNINNPNREDIDEIGKIVGIDYIVNGVINEKGILMALFAGHYLDAHRAAVRFAEKQLCPAIPGKADIVIVSAYPCNIDYWQGEKPIGFSLPGVKQGGVIIFLFDPLEGMCNNSPVHKATLEKYLLTDEATVRRDAENGTLKDIVGTIHPIYHFQIIENVTVFCVTCSLTQEECDLMRFKRYEDAEPAIRDAIALMGEDAKIGIIPCGGETVVRVAD